MRLRRALVRAACLLLAVPALAQAQAAPDAADNARFHFGPLAVTPRLTIQNLGVDTNVFNAPNAPVRDGTAVVTPGADAWLRVGRVLISSRTTTDLIYYRTAASERSLNLSEIWRVEGDVLHVLPRVAGQYLRTRQRPNEEVDQRVQQKQVSGGVGVTIPAGARVRVDADASRTRIDFSEGTYGDSAVAQALNRESDRVALAARFDVSPLTSVGVRADSTRDRFVFASERNSQSLRIMPGVTFQPFALISGRAFVGFRRFVTLSAAVPDYSGVVADVELTYSALDMFRVTGQVRRDVDYSLDLNEPFFISTSAGMELMQIVGLNWDVVGRARRVLLTYQPNSFGSAARTDRMTLWGLGLGRRIGDELRLGVDVDLVQRRSVLPSRTFDGMRIGGSVTYGY